MHGQLLMASAPISLDADDAAAFHILASGQLTPPPQQKRCTLRHDYLYILFYTNATNTMMLTIYFIESNTGAFPYYATIDTQRAPAQDKKISCHRHAYRIHFQAAFSPASFSRRHHRITPQC